MNTTQKTVLITGASSGIGYELARCFARDEYRILMVAHFLGKLEAAADNLKEEFPESQIITYACDLSLPGGPEEVFAEVQRQGLQIDVLVNNAGYGEHGFFAETNLEKELRMVQLNTSSMLHLTKLFLQQMLSRNEGKILQLASENSFIPLPLMAVYAATKAFILSFSEALQNELQDTKVSVTILCPAATDTNFFKVAGAENTRVAQGDLDDPKDVAKAGYEGLMNGEPRVLPTFKAKMHVAQAHALPDSVLASQMRKQMEEEKPKTKSGTRAKAKSRPTPEPEAAATLPPSKPTPKSRKK